MRDLVVQRQPSLAHEDFDRAMIYFVADAHASTGFAMVRSVRLGKRDPDLKPVMGETRYTLVPSTLLDKSFSFNLLRTTPVRKPRTECCCQPVACIMVAIVAPEGDCSIATTCDCFEPGSFVRAFRWNPARDGSADVEAPIAVVDAAVCVDFAAGAGSAVGPAARTLFAAGITAATSAFFADFDFARLDIETLRSLMTRTCRHHRSPVSAAMPAGQESQSAQRPKPRQYRSNHGPEPVISG